jgi:hypothetical protein
MILKNYGVIKMGIFEIRVIFGQMAAGSISPPAVIWAYPSLISLQT